MFHKTPHLKQYSTYILRIYKHYLCLGMFFLISLELSLQINDYCTETVLKSSTERLQMVTYATQTLYFCKFPIFYPVLFLYFAEQYM